MTLVSQTIVVTQFTSTSAQIEAAKQATLAAKAVVDEIMTTLESLVTDLDKVLEVQADLTAINTIQTKLTEIEAVYTDITKITSVADALTAVNAVYSALSDITVILNNLVAINTAADNIANINLAPKAAEDAIAAQQEIETLVGDPEEMLLEYFVHSDTDTGFPVTNNKVLNLQIGTDVYQINVKKV